MNRHLKWALRDIDLGFEDLEIRTAEDGSWVQIRSKTLPPAFNSGRKWTISDHMTRSEVVQTIFKALLTWWEHEVRESFKYMGQAIFGPHIDVLQLVELVATTATDVRGAA